MALPPNHPAAAGNLIARAQSASADALNQTAETVKDAAIAGAPMVTGHLHESAFIDEAMPSYLRATVGFNAPYAQAVEGDIGQPEQYVHGGGPHFLEHALLAAVPTLAPTLARHVRKKF